MKNRHIAFIALGSNLGNRQENILKAINEISLLKETVVLKTSRLYETKAWGPIKDQDDFINAVIKIEHSYSAQDLLEELVKIEAMYKYKKEVKYGPRFMDLDILLYDNLSYKKDGLIIPHQFLEDRIFVVAPLAEIEPELKLPNNKKIKEILKDLKEEEFTIL